MSLPLILLLLGVFLFLSAVFAGSETGVYTVSRVWLDSEARGGRRRARILRKLLRDDAGILVTLLIGNNLMLELLTHVFEAGLVPAGLPPWSDEIFVTIVVTPVVFFLGELWPKDVFHRRPQTLLLFSTPILFAARLLFLPLAWPIKGLGIALGKLAGLSREERTPSHRREEMFELLREGTRSGALAPRAEVLARNVLVLRESPVESVMVPWSEVLALDLGQPEGDLRDAVASATFTRLPVTRAVEQSGGAPAPAPENRDQGASDLRVLGYVHQLEVLGGEQPVEDHLRPLPCLDPGLPLDRALARLRLAGQRLALVGSERDPRGLVTLMDLVATLSRESGPGRAGRSDQPGPGVGTGISSGVAATQGSR